MKLYYYMGPQYLRDNLQKRRVKVSRFGKYGTLNDPFELSPFDISDPKFRDVYKAKIDGLAQNLGLICFSKTRHSPAMWAHYAEKHTGACLEFEVTCGNVIKVKYDSKKLFPGITVATFHKYINANNLPEVFSTKSKDWAYEKEHRMHIALENKIVVKEGVHHFVPFQNEADFTFSLKRVFVGYRFELGISNLENDVKGYLHNVKVAQTRPAFRKFKVVRQRDKRFWNMDPRKGETLPAVQAVFGSNKT